MDKFNKATEWLFSGTTYGITGAGIIANWGDIKAGILFVIAVIIGVFQIMYWYKKQKGTLK